MYHPFVLPFVVGFSVMGVVLVARYLYWLRDMSPDNRQRVLRGMISRSTMLAVGEIFRESLLHLKISRVNPLLGFMHASLAFGWFMLIVGGKLETWYYTGNFFNPPYYAIFFRYFEPLTEGFWMNGVLLFYMELSLLIVLSGLSIAVVKRIRKKVVGMKNTTKHNPANRIALFFLWMVFPLRLMAESATVAVHGGGSFLTTVTSSLFLSHHWAVWLELPLWWAYSTGLGLFFLALPFSRYLHIPTEMVALLLKHWSVQPEAGFNPEKGVQAFEVHSCPGCGVCLDVCPAMGAGINSFQSAYFVRQVRAGQNYETMADSCLNCGACKDVCPVGINLENLRLDARSHLHRNANFDHRYLHGTMTLWRDNTEVVLYTGCMGRINPKTTQAVKSLLREAGVKFVHLDENESICCGRPMALTGAGEHAKLLIQRNRELIHGQNGQLLVTTCPICYRYFSSEYDLNIPVLHHSQFLWQLVETRKLNRHKGRLRYAYHDPCELGRGANCYDEPRNLLQTVGELMTLSSERNGALCCGNNIGSLTLAEEQKQKITANTLTVLFEKNPDYIVTACPLCKNTLSRQSTVPVRDLAEVMLECKEVEAAGYRTRKKQTKVSATS